MRQLLRASQERQAAAAAAAGDARAWLLARLQVARRLQERWEDSELSHGTERWQQQQVVLHEMDLARRDAASSIAASQERQVARLWMKLQRHLTHPRAPWAPALVRALTPRAVLVVCVREPVAQNVSWWRLEQAGMAWGSAMGLGEQWCGPRARMHYPTPNPNPNLNPNPNPNPNPQPQP